MLKDGDKIGNKCLILTDFKRKDDYMKQMPYKIKQKLRQYANIQNKAKLLQREVENMIEEYNIPIENLIAMGNPLDFETPQTEALAFLHNGECDDIEGTIKEIEKVFLYFVNREN